MIEYGVTGTDIGMNVAQLKAARALLSKLPAGSVQHNGMCIGADEHFCLIAREYGHLVHAHPGEDDSGHSPKRSTLADNYWWKIEEPLGYMTRNAIIASSGTFALYAAPFENEEVVRSGTWATVRRARKLSRRVYVLKRQP
jgi:hypothetical protein